MSVETGDRITRVYSGFRGVDFRGEEINLIRSPDSVNVWKDYKETESIRTRPGMKLHTAFEKPIYGMYLFKGTMYVHSGTDIYKILADGRTIIEQSGMNERESNGFVFDDKLYIMDGKNFLYLGEYGFQDVTQANDLEEYEPYVPTTSIARKPEGGGKIYQDVNMLSDYRINTFLADGVSTDFYLDVTKIDKGYTPKIEFPDDETIPFDVDYDEGVIKFETAPPAPKTDGQDNVSIRFKKAVPKYKDIIHKCTLLQVFDNRVFVSGNPDYPNMVWHCSLSDPSYFSDLDYYQEGMDEAAVKGMVAGNNALWVFREPSEANTNVFYHTPASDDEYGKIYPSSHSSITIGCVGKAINFNDDIIFFSERGMEGISGDVTTEQVAGHRSSLVDRKMIPGDDADGARKRISNEYKNMKLVEWEGYLLVFIGKKVFLADSRATFTNENHLEYEWFYWELEKNITCAKVYDNVLYLGTEDGLYTLNDMTCDIESYWVTPIDKFKAPHKLKTTNKRGCVAEATGDISVYAKIEDTDFELIGTYENVTDYFASRIKRKKFKDIQLKFYSKTRFSLETVTLECFIGGYIKR